MQLVFRLGLGYSTVMFAIHAVANGQETDNAQFAASPPPSYEQVEKNPPSYEDVLRVMTVTSVVNDPCQSSLQHVVTLK